MTLAGVEKAELEVLRYFFGWDQEFCAPEGQRMLGRQRQIQMIGPELRRDN